MAKRIDLHVQALQDRIKRIDAEIREGESRCRAARAELDASVHKRIDAQLRLKAALDRVSAERIAQEGALSKERKHARRVKSRKPGQFILTMLTPITLGEVHIGRTNVPNAAGIVTVDTLCGKKTELAREVAMQAARQTHGDLAIALGQLRALRRETWGSYRRRTCDRCVTEARAQLRPAKDEEAPDV